MDNSNLINLKVLDLDNILNNLEQRYNENKIYTKINQIIIAMNPFKKVDLLEDQPHPDNLSIDCYNDMLKHNKNLSILVSGESGAGKTETTKILLKKLLSLSSQNDKLLEQIYWSNYILESFGNAKTIRNHNSSRFGKFINIYFKQGEIVSAKIETYLLEKIRITNKSIDERNFHIFYQLFPELVNYKFIKTNNLYDDNIDDQQGLKDLQKAFEYFNINDETFTFIKNIIHSIILFSDYENNKNNISELLEIPIDILEKQIKFKTIKVGKETIEKNLDDKEINIKIETLCNELYSKLFTYLVDIINKELSNGVIVDCNKDIKSISLLDIFGFEILQDNSIEQLCINYTNEILQNTFNKYFFEKEQELYISEGLPFDLVEFSNNDDIIKCIEKTVFGTVDEVSKFINGKSSQIIDKLFKNTNETISINNLQKSKENFTINHYADSVEYNLELFLQKNILNLPDDIVKLFTHSNNTIIKRISIIKSKDSLLQSFKKQINMLKDKINKTKVNFIRCIKPNDQMKPLILDQHRTIEQLKYNGVEEAIRVARQGYPIRINNDIFDKLYFMIPKDKLDFVIRGYTITFLTKDNENKLNDMKKEIQIKMAIKIQSYFKMIITRKAYLRKIQFIIKLQSIIRMFIQFYKYQKYIKNSRAIIIQKYWKGYKQYIIFNKIKFIVKWLTFRRIQQIKYRKLIKEKVILLEKNMQVFLLKCNIIKFLHKIQIIKGFIQMIKAKKLRRELRKEAKDINRLKVRLKELDNFKKLNKKLEKEKEQEKFKQQEIKSEANERFLMYQEDILMKQYLQQIKNQILLEETKRKEELLLQEKLKVEEAERKELLLMEEKRKLEDENNQLIKQFVEKDLENINKMIHMEAQLSKMRRELEDSRNNDYPTNCIIS